MAWRNRPTPAASFPSGAPEPAASGTSVAVGVGLVADALVAVPSPGGFEQVPVTTVRLGSDRVIVAAPKADLPGAATVVITIALPTGRVCLLGELDDATGPERAIDFAEVANDLVLTFLSGARR